MDDLRNVRISVEGSTRRPILLWYEGENLATTVTFDLSPWQARYGAGTASLLAKRCGDELAYLIPLEQEGTEAVWRVSAADCSAPGQGEAQLFYSVDGVRAKSAVWSTLVERSIGNTGDAPEPSNLLDSVVELAAQAAQSAQDAESSAEQARNALSGLTASVTILPTGSVATIAQSINQNGGIALDFSIPKGDTGEKGPQGEKGDTGAAGPQGPQGADL